MKYRIVCETHLDVDAESIDSAVEKAKCKLKSVDGMDYVGVMYGTTVQEHTVQEGYSVQEDI